MYLLALKYKKSYEHVNAMKARLAAIEKIMNNT